MNGPMTYGYLIGGAVVTSLLYGPSLLRYTKERDWQADALESQHD